MSKLAPLALIVAGSLVVAACATHPDDATESASDLAAHGPHACNLISLRFPDALYQDLTKTLDPQYTTAGKIAVPGAIDAATDGAFTTLVTVLAAQVSFYPDDDTHVKQPLLELEGGVPDTLNGDRAAHKLYDAMTRATNPNGDSKTSVDGQFECHIEGWKGGNLYVCSFPNVIDARGVSEASGVCN